jgi:hypothetical protein
VSVHWSVCCAGSSVSTVESGIAFAFFIHRSSLCVCNFAFGNLELQSAQTNLELSKEMWLFLFTSLTEHNTHTHTHTHTSREKQQLTSTSAMMTLAIERDYRSERESRTLLHVACVSFSCVLPTYRGPIQGRKELLPSLVLTAFLLKCRMSTEHGQSARAGEIHRKGSLVRSAWQFSPNSVQVRGCRTLFHFRPILTHLGAVHSISAFRQAFRSSLRAPGISLLLHFSLDT